MMSRQKLNIVVVGAGVIGLSAALHITERFPGLVDVTLIADKFTPNTTSDKSGMLLLPVDFASRDDDKPSDEVEYQEKVKHWSRETFARFHSIYRSELNSEVQICLRSGYLTQYKLVPDPWWKECVFGFRHIDLKSDEARTANVSPRCIDLWAFTTYTGDCSTYLAWMMRAFQANGGVVVKNKLTTLDELSSYDVVINCTGLGARELVEEHDMQPLRGQLVLVQAPWVTNFYIDEDETKGDFAYFIPRANSVVLGGTFEHGNWNEEPNSETTQKILENCFKLEPSLAKAKIIGGWAGLRPLRSRTRLDATVDSYGKLMIHCYGQGGQGVVLSWGCAKEIGNIVQRRDITERKLICEFNFAFSKNDVNHRPMIICLSKTCMA